MRKGETRVVCEDCCTVNIVDVEGENYCRECGRLISSDYIEDEYLRSEGNGTDEVMQ